MRSNLAILTTTNTIVIITIATVIFVTTHHDLHTTMIAATLSQANLVFFASDKPINGLCPFSIFFHIFLPSPLYLSFCVASGWSCELWWELVVGCDNGISETAVGMMYMLRRERGIFVFVFLRYHWVMKSFPPSP
jgi:hypothetical protein